MSDGCQCEYLSEECGGGAVVCQYCHDEANAEIKRLRAEVNRLTARLDAAERAEGVTVPRDMLVRLARHADELADWVYGHGGKSTTVNKIKADAQAARRAAGEET